MAYDYPYRLETDVRALTGVVVTTYSIARTGVGIICTGTSFDAMRELVDSANLLATAKAPGECQCSSKGRRQKV